MKKYIKPLVVASAIASVGVGSFGAVHAADAVAKSTDSSSLVDEIANKFNLNKTEVQKVFTDHKQKAQETMIAKRTKTLDTALQNKKITQDQYNYIMNAWKNIDVAQQKAEISHSKTDREAVKTQMRTLRTWMKEQKIDTASIMPEFRHKAFEKQ